MAPAPPPEESPFECQPAMQDLMPETICMLQLKGTLKDKDVPTAVGVVKKLIGRGYKKMILDLTHLKWTFINAGHMRDMVEAARTAGVDVRILAPDPEVRQATQRHRVQASIQSSLKDVLDGF